MSKEAVIYDVDGTLINSEPLHVEAWKRTLAKHGRVISELPDEFQQTMAGKKPIVIATGMVNELGINVAPEFFLKSKTEIFLSLSSAQLEAMPGSVESVIRLHEAGYRLAIGTSLDRVYLESVLLKLAITEIFEVVVTGDEILKGKPDPETYLVVTEKLNLSPSQCVVLEDARTGVEAAKSSGAFCIAIENKNAEPQDLSAADLVMNSLDELTIDIIQAL